MKVKLIVISIILLLVIVFASGCIPVMEKLGLVSPTNEEQLSPEKGGPPDGLVKVLIGFKEKPGPAQQALVKGVGGKIKYTYNLIPAIAASVPEVAIEPLKKNPNVTNIELDSMVYTLDTELDSSWGVKRIGAGVVHDSGKNGKGIKIAVIDTGIDKDHPDLDYNLKGGENFVSKPSWRTPDPNKWDDDNGHGTHVAGIIAAEDNNTGVVGVAPGAELYALKVLDRTGSGYVSDVVMAIQWATVNEIQIINMSLGSTYDSWLLDGACLLAYAEGLILVAAAGNGGSVIYPAAYPWVIAVSATNSADELAWFSSTGPEVELAAPGEDIYSTYKGGGYATLSGTSMACPHVAEVGWDGKYGHGLVDAAEAAGVSGGGQQPPITGTMHVENIIFLAKKAGKNLFLYTTVEVLLGDKSAVNGARVTMTLSDGTSSWNFSSDTGSDGTVKFTLLKAQPGGYTATVTDVSHTDYEWVDGETEKSCNLDKDGNITP
jgi:hypothetical protein